MEFLPSYIRTFFNLLVVTSAMAGILGLIILLIRLIVKDLGSRWQNALWMLLMIRLLLPITPQTSFSLYNLFSINNGFVNQSELQRPQSESAGPLKPVNPSTEANPKVETPNRDFAADRTVSSEGPGVSHLFSFNLFNILFFVWLIGALSFGGYIILWQMRFTSFIKGELLSVEPDTVNLFDHCKQMMQIKQTIQIVKTSKVSSPTLFGLIHPRLLLPKEITNVLSQEQLKHVLLHELAHFKRKDILLNWVSSILLAIHWFNPILWVAFSKMQEDQEIACDAMVISCIGPVKSKEYGLTIIKLLEAYSHPLGLPGMARLLGRNSGIKRRMGMIAMAKRHSLKGILLGLSLTAVLCVVGLTNARSPVPQPNNPVKDTSVVLGTEASGKQTNGPGNLTSGGTGVDTTALMEKYLKDHGYKISTATGGGNLAGAPIQLPDDFNAVINGVKIGQMLLQKNELSKRNNLDFAQFLGQKVSVFEWGLQGKGNSPNGLNGFFLIHDGQIVGAWFEPEIGNGEKNTTLGILENLLKH